MDLILMEASALLLLAVAIWVFRRRWATLGIFNPATFERLEQVERNAEQTKQSCSSALADIQKNLASLEQRTAAAEQKLAGHGATPARQHKEFYHAAALLLYAGHPAARVADVLDLSLAQVEMVRELQKMIAAENPPDAAQESQVANYTSDKTPKRKNPGARQGKSRTRPILLTDIVASESLAVDAGDRRAEMNGAAVERRTDETFVAC
jgi:hypothetical protein